MTVPAPTIRSQITAIILAGGQGKRMGGKDKGLVKFCNHSLIQSVIEKILPQVEHVMINANRNTAEYEAFGYPVIADAVTDFQGPLAGFMAAMNTVSSNYIVCVPCDGPMLSDKLVQRLYSQLERENTDIAVAHDGNRMQPVYVLISTHLKTSLQEYLQSGERKIDRWYANHKISIVDFSDIPETFININTRQERDSLQNKRNAA